MSTIEIEYLPLNPMIIATVRGTVATMHLTPADCTQGVALEISMDSKMAATCDCHIIGSFTKLTDAQVVLEVAGNTVYDVVAAGMGDRYLGAWTLDFKTALTNTVWFKAGSTTGGIAFPAVLPPLLTLVVEEEATITTVSVVKTKKMEG